jgi:hypothetical protein
MKCIVWNSHFVKKNGHQISLATGDWKPLALVSGAAAFIAFTTEHALQLPSIFREAATLMQPFI